MIKGTISALKELKQLNRYLPCGGVGIVLEANMGALGTNWRDLTYSCFFLLRTVRVYIQPHVSPRQDRIKRKYVELHSF